MELNKEYGSFKDHMNKIKDAFERVEEVKTLPVEDNIWLIEEVNFEDDENGQEKRYLLVNDKFSYCIGHGVSNSGKSDVSFIQECRELMCICTLYPMIGVPRRPRKVTFKDPVLAKRAAGLDLSDMGIIYTYAGKHNGNVSTPLGVMRECSVCKLRGSKDLFKKCSMCKAVLYCCKKCEQGDWVRKGMEEHSHKYWCDRMKTYMDKHEQLADLPFSFIKEVTNGEFDSEKYCEFLKYHGVYNQGAWRHECLLHNTDHSCCPEFGELTSDDLIVLPVESTVLDEPLVVPIPDIRDWRSYYNLRGFRLDSPIAILLQWPLTVFHIIKHCLPTDYPDKVVIADSELLLVDVLGVEKEVDCLSIFKELSYLLPGQSLDIVLYGNEISKLANDRDFKTENLQMKVVKGLYHKKAYSSRTPHLVIGFNAGLGAYPQWAQTLVKLRANRIPAYFTDYCQYSCECARTVVEELRLGNTSDPVVNPFRSPVRKLALENDMPWYSNGFLYHLVYP